MPSILWTLQSSTLQIKYFLPENILPIPLNKNVKKKNKMIFLIWYYFVIFFTSDKKIIVCDVKCLSWAIKFNVINLIFILIRIFFLISWIIHALFNWLLHTFMKENWFMTWGLHFTSILIWTNFAYLLYSSTTTCIKIDVYH